MSVKQALLDKYPGKTRVGIGRILGVSAPTISDIIVNNAHSVLVAQRLSEMYPEYIPLYKSEVARVKRLCSLGGKNRKRNNRGGNKVMRRGMPAIDSNDITRYTLPVLYPRPEIDG